MEQELKKISDQAAAEVAGGEEGGTPAVNTICPACGSTDVTYWGRDPFCGANEYSCNSCGNHWETYD